MAPCYVFAVILFGSCCVRAEVILGVENEDFDFDGLPGMSHEFRFLVDGGQEFCLYKKMEANMEFYVQYEVLRGGNKVIDIFLKSPASFVIQSKVGEESGYFQEIIQEPGVYTVCLDNTSQRFSSKLVYIYFHIHKPEQWIAYNNEINDLVTTTEVFEESLSQVRKSISEAEKHAATRRFAFARDYYHVYSSGERVRHYSIAMCVIIVLTSLLQVVFVRRLFKEVLVTPSRKPRA